MSHPAGGPNKSIETRREGGKVATDLVTEGVHLQLARRSTLETGESQAAARKAMDPPTHSQSTPTTSTSSNSEEKVPSRPITEEDIHKLRGELQQSLQEEEQLTVAQMQLILQLEKVNGSIISLEKEERMGKLAIQQAQILRLLKKAQDPGNNEIDDEIITITPER